MTYALGVVFFVVALLVSVMLHEAGHFLTAKRFGMKATRFFVGFGPTLWSTKRGETEYGVKAIPAGGFVKIVGMTQLEGTEPGDEERVFWKQPAGKRAIVLSAGSAVHLVLAVIMVFGYLLVTHVDPVTGVLRVAAEPNCVTATSNLPCTPADPRAPAAGKLHKGDVIVSVNGEGVSGNSNTLTNVVQRSIGKPVTLEVDRQGQRVVVRMTPIPITIDGRTVGRVGVQNELAPRHVSAAEAVPRTFTVLGSFFTSTVSALGDLPHQVKLILNDEPRGSGAASVVDIARVSGQVAEARTSVGDRLATLLLIVAQLNFFVGIFNMLPLLPLDGGHVGILAYEEGRRRLYRLLGRRDPGRVDLMKVMPVTYAVLAVFIGLSLLLLYAGIVNPIRIQ